MYSQVNLTKNYACNERKRREMNEEKKNPETLGDLCSHMLSSPMPASEETRDALLELCVRPTCAAFIVFGMIQKAARGDDQPLSR